MKDFATRSPKPETSPRSVANRSFDTRKRLPFQVSKMILPRSATTHLHVYRNPLRNSHVRMLVVMNVLTAFALALLSRPTVSALTLAGPSLIQPGSAITNATSLSYVFKCSAAEYGRNLDSASCMDALHQIDASSTIEQTYGPRFTGPYDVKLPKRYISANGLCVIEPRLVSQRISARASPQEVATAARRLINRCVNMLPSQGGRVHRIGGDNNLDILVFTFQPEPEVNCFGRVSPSLLSSCQNIVDTMPVSRDPTTYGPDDDPSAVVKLPLTYYSQDQKCLMKIRTDGHSDTESRYNFWTAAVVLTGVCIRDGQMGFGEGLGLSDHLTIAIGPAGSR